MMDLAAEKFVSLTTYRRSGEGVSTPVWVARDGDELVVSTPVATGKVKRLRNDPRVELRPSSRLGRVDPDAPAASGTARIVDDPAGVRRMTAAIRRKYGLEWRVITFVEGLFARKHGARVILRIAV
jgi:PPOX class probable F420-dependent enzyme